VLNFINRRDDKDRYPQDEKPFVVPCTAVLDVNSNFIEQKKSVFD
jgi:hypothetical protein